MGRDAGAAPASREEKLTMKRGGELEEHIRAVRLSANSENLTDLAISIRVSAAPFSGLGGDPQSLARQLL